jgi:hypothetical protein
VIAGLCRSIIIIDLLLQGTHDIGIYTVSNSHSQLTENFYNPHLIDYALPSLHWSV